MIQPLINIFSKLKYYYDNSKTYTTVLSFILTLTTWQKVYNIKINFIVLSIVSIIIITFIGYLDYKFLLNKYTEHGNKKNDIKEQLDRIEQRLELMDTKNINTS